MSCRISISDVQGVLDSAGLLTAIRIRGASSECRRIELRISCLDRTVGGLLEDTRLVDLAADGSFDVTVPTIPTLRCARCRVPLTVTVSCLIEGDVFHPECAPATLTQPLWCADESCPVVVTSAAVSPDCNSDRTRTVTFHVRVTAPASWVVETRLETGDGTIFPATAERDYMRLHRYDASRAGTFVPRVHIERPVGCPDVELPPVHVPFCPEPPPVPVPCPRISSVIIAGTVVPTRTGCQIFWVADTIPHGAPGTFEWSFDRGTHGPPIPDRIQERAYTTSGEKIVDVLYTPARAGCPTSRGAGSTRVEGCEAPSGGGESSLCLIARFGAIIAFTAGLAILALYLCLTPAPPPAPPPTPDEATLRNTALLVGGGLLVVGLLTFILWYALCAERPCKPWLLFLGLALIGAGVALLHLTSCCPVFALIGIGSVTAGVLLMLWWRSECSITWCGFFHELAFFNGAAIVVILLLLVAFLPRCLPAIADALAGELSFWETFGVIGIVLYDLASIPVLAEALRCDGGFGDVERHTDPRLRDPESPITPGP